MNTLPKIFSAFSLTVLLSACPGSGGDSSSTTTTTTTIYGLAFDAVNTKLYIANVGRSTIQSIDPTDLTSTPVTLAGGDNVTGATNGDGTAARFYYPAGLAMGSGFSVNVDTLYVADSFNNVLRIVTTLNGLKTVATFAGGFNTPNDLTADNINKIIYVADTGNNSIRKVTMGINPAVSLLAGSTEGASGNTDATGNLARFNQPAGIAVDPATQTVYVSDFSNHLIRKITNAGVVTTIAGVATSPATSGYDNAAIGTNAKFKFPTTLVFSADALYVTDTGNHAIRKIDLSTVNNTVTTFAGANIADTSGLTDATGTNARFSYPRGITLNGDATVMYIGDQSGTKLRKITIPGGIVTTFTKTF